jgi:hypothetical protein
MQKIARLQEETVRAIVKNSTEMAMFKEMTSQQLKDLRDFATRSHREPVSIVKNKQFIALSNLPCVAKLGRNLMVG